MTQTAGAAARPADEAAARHYPTRPIVGVGAVIAIPQPDGSSPADTRIVLIRRRFDPLAGHWSLPGGAVEIGETLEAAVIREMKEETGLDVDVGPVVEVFDRITRDSDGRVAYHYVLIDYLCRAAGGTLQAGSDVSAVELADPSNLASYALTEKTLEVIEKAVGLARIVRA